MAATSFSSRSLRRAPMATFAPRSASSLAAASAGGRTGAPFPAVVVLLDQAVLLLFRETEVVAVDGVLVDRVALEHQQAVEIVAFPLVCAMKVFCAMRLSVSSISSPFS